MQNNTILKRVTLLLIMLVLPLGMVGKNKSEKVFGKFEGEDFTINIGLNQTTMSLLRTFVNTGILGGSENEWKPLLDIIPKTEYVRVRVPKNDEVSEKISHSVEKHFDALVNSSEGSVYLSQEGDYIEYLIVVRDDVVVEVKGNDLTMDDLAEIVVAIQEWK